MACREVRRWDEAGRLAGLAHTGNKALRGPAGGIVRTGPPKTELKFSRLHPLLSANSFLILQENSPEMSGDRDGLHQSGFSEVLKQSQQTL